VYYEAGSGKRNKIRNGERVIRKDEMKEENRNIMKVGIE
jgi:hypothetical protein